MYHQEEDNSMPRNFFYWKDIFPFLNILLENFEIIKNESKLIPKWIPWPEDHFNLSSKVDNSRDWTVFPLLHTFPATEEKNMKWVSSTCNICPKTTEILKKIPNIRTALFSKLGPGTQLSTHTGWSELANHVLRCHLSLEIPKSSTCGLLVDGEVQYHSQGGIIVFDDSKPHRAFNLDETESRIVLIVDIMRPENIPLGTATGHMTDELDNFIDLFK